MSESSWSKVMSESSQSERKRIKKGVAERMNQDFAH